MYCTTTDPYQVLRHKDPLQQKSLGEHGRFLVRRSLALIRDRSTLNVRVLTRSPMARLDFELFRSFGTRLAFGMSLPTLRNDLAKVYEPKAPAPSQRLATLQAAKAAGLHVFVAVAPTYPDCDEADLRATLEAVKALDPITVFHEPINLRAENAARIADGARRQGIEIDTAAFASRAAWSRYALVSLKMVWRLSAELGMRDRVHLWPDKALGARQVVQSMPQPQAYERWLRARWDRVSEWPG
jgi:DNA repair photolyase